MTAEFLNSETYRPWVTFENNTASQVIVIDDETYEDYFNEDGTAKATLPEEGFTLMIGYLNDKNMILSGSDFEVIPLDDSTYLYDCEIILDQVCSVKISGLTIRNTNKNGLHILEGYKIAQDNIDEVIQIIKTAESDIEAKEKLICFS